MNSKNKKVIYISVISAIAALIILVAIFWSSISVPSNDTGISDILSSTDTATSTASSTNGISSQAVVLGSRTVTNKAAYERIRSNWIWVKTTYTNPAFASSVPSKDKSFTLILNEDKSLSVAGDCNTIKGTYTLAENIVSALETEDEISQGKMKVKASAITKKACEWSKESSFITDLVSASSYIMRPTLLEIPLSNGRGSISFKRVVETEGQ